MTASLSVHRVANITVRSYYPGNSHSICLGFPRKDDLEEVQIDLFDMSEERALAFLTAMSGITGATIGATVYNVSGGGNMSLYDYLTERQVHKALGSDPA